MRFYLVIKLFLVTFIIYGQNQDSSKCWRENDKLTWSDFKGVPPIEDSTSFAKATSPTRILVRPVKIKGVLTYRVTPIFITSKAWKKDTSIALLEHEQLHFDLAELYARKLRKEIALISLKIKEPKSSDFRLRVETLLVDFSERQDKYDSETLNGLYLKGQNEWNEKVNEELSELKIYASTEIDCFYVSLK